MATLTRDVLGRLASYGASQISGVRSLFDTADWTGEGNTPTISLSSGNLVVGVTSTAGGRAYARLSAHAQRADVYVQATCVAQTRPGSAPSLLSRYGSTAEFLEFGAAFSNQNIIRERSGGVDTQSVLRSPITFVNRFQMRTQGTAVHGMPFSVGSSISLTGVALSSANWMALGCYNNNGINTNGNVRYGEYYATRNAQIKVSSSLANGWYIVVRDASANVLAESNQAVAGIATIDAYDFRLVLPLVATIEVREFATGNVLISNTPTETVWPGDEWTFTPSGGYTPPTTVSRLNRSVSGKVVAFAQFSIIPTFFPDVVNPFVASNWTGFSATGTSTASIDTSGNLSVAVNSGSGVRGSRFNLSTVPQNHFAIAARVSQTTGGSAGVAGRINGATPTQNLVSSTIPHGFSGSFATNEYVSGSIVSQATSGTANRTISSASLHSQWVRGLLATSRQTSSAGTGVADATLNLTSLNAATVGEYAGVWTSSSGANTFVFQSFSVLRSALITVTGPNEGTWQVRLRNAAGTVIYTSSSHTAGVVEINTQTELTTLYSSAGLSLMAQVEIYEPADATVLRGPEAPREYIWGGDEWAWNNAPPGPSYPPGRLVHRKAGAQRLLLKQ